jgi:pimeloyl-ACP methyl ester carboxylesterase
LTRRTWSCRWVAWVLPLTLWACASAPATPEPAHDIRGNGRPTVVLASGFAMPRSTWKAVADNLSQDFTVFTFDRPGYGRQPDTDRPRDPCTIATETRQALRSAGLLPPYLLVGHSLGGLHQYAFARLYPQEVSGLVLLDPTHPSHWATLQASQPMLAKALKGMVALRLEQALRNEFRQQAQCLEPLVATAAPAPPGRLLFSRRYREIEKDFSPAVQQLQEDWKTLTGGAAASLLWDSGHHIQTERPDAIANAVRALAGRAPAAVRQGTQVNVGARGDWSLTLGATRQQTVEARLGPPNEIQRDGDRTVWVYTAPGVRVPLAISLIPVIGDIADLIELGQSGIDRYETIIEFDVQGVVQQARRRRIED